MFAELMITKEIRVQVAGITIFPTPCRSLDYNMIEVVMDHAFNGSLISSL